MKKIILGLAISLLSINAGLAAFPFPTSKCSDDTYGYNDNPQVDCVYHSGVYLTLKDPLYNYVPKCTTATYYTLLTTNLYYVKTAAYYQANIDYLKSYNELSGRTFDQTALTTKTDAIAKSLFNEVALIQMAAKRSCEASDPRYALNSPTQVSQSIQGFTETYAQNNLELVNNGYKDKTSGVITCLNTFKLVNGSCIADSVVATTSIVVNNAPAITLAATSTVTNASSTAKASISSNLTIGSKGTDTLTLQKGLGLDPTGYFGSLTKKAVIEWQKKNALSPTGYFGPASRKVWNSSNH